MRALASIDSSSACSTSAACQVRSRPCLPAHCGPRNTARQWQPTAHKPPARRLERLICGVGFGPNGSTSGYTPASYITYSEEEKHFCAHEAKVVVDAPASVCFGLWDDWHRIVDYIDLVAQIGLDPNEPNMGLFQCFYRWGKLPVMEIVFLAVKEQVVPDEAIFFSTAWGMPLSGHVHFRALSGSQTEVTLSFDHALPRLLVDMKVGKLGVETHMASILKENMAEFKKLAEAVHSKPAAAPRRQEAVEKPHMKPDELSLVELEEQEQQTRAVVDAMSREVPADARRGDGDEPSSREAQAEAAAAAKGSSRTAAAGRAAAGAAPGSAAQQAAAAMARGKGAAAAAGDQITTSTRKRRTSKQ